MSLKTASLPTLAVLALAASLLSGCNTVAGAGKDTSSLGHAVTNSANGAK